MEKAKFALFLCIFLSLANLLNATCFPDWSGNFTLIYKNMDSPYPDSGECLTSWCTRMSIQYSSSCDSVIITNSSNGKTSSQSGMSKSTIQESAGMCASCSSSIHWNYTLYSSNNSIVFCQKDCCNFGDKCDKQCVWMRDSTDFVPIFISTNPTITSSSTTIFLSLTLSNTDGTIYIGLGSANATNHTAPTWSQLMAQTDVNGEALTDYKEDHAIKGVTANISFTNLSAGTTYNIFFGAGNLNIPQEFGSIYVLSTKTTFNGFSGKMMLGFTSLLIAFLTLIFL